jgi:hypothetical protein
MADKDLQIFRNKVPTMRTNALWAFFNEGKMIPVIIIFGILTRLLDRDPSHSVHYSTTTPVVDVIVA